MLVIFQGGESTDHLLTVSSVRELDGGDVPITMSASWRGLLRRNRGPDHVAAMATQVNPVLEGGYSTVEDLNHGQAQAMERDYYDFAFRAPELVFAVQFDHPALGQRPVSDPRVVPLLQDHKALKQTLADCGSVAMPLVEDTKIAALFRRNPTMLALALGSADLAAAHRGGFNVAMTSAWYAPGRFGEISLWDGQHFHRRNSTEREHLLRIHGHYLQSKGLDIDALLSDDSRELNRLAVWSYLQWAATFPDPFKEIPASSDTTASDPVEDPPDVPERIEVRSESRRPAAPRLSTPLRMIPGFLKDDVGEPQLLSTGVSLRQCDKCFLADVCPAFTKASSCAFGFPVEVRTPAQVKALLGTMVEIQAGRVAFAKMAEDLNGGYPDEQVGVEMDRLFKMADQLTRPAKREKLTVSVESESQGGGTGVLSAIFGRRQEPAPMQVIEQAVPERTD